MPEKDIPISAETDKTDKATPSAAASGVVTAAVVLQAINSIGQPSQALGYAVKILHDIPTGLIEAAREPYKARALIYALVINPEQEIRDKQLTHLAQFADQGVHDETLILLPQLKELEKRFRLPLIDIAMGTLRQLSPAQYERFRQNLRMLIEADNKIDLFEWVLQKIVQHHLDNEFEKRSPMGRTAKFSQLAQLRQECVLILSLLAYSGNTSELTAQQAFESAAQQLGLPGVKLAPQAAINLNVLNTAIDKLAMLKPLVKPQFLKACAASITADGVVTATELELLPAIANTIDCPMPPLDSTGS